MLDAGTSLMCTMGWLISSASRDLEQREKHQITINFDGISSILVSNNIFLR